jgi:hypothetical protein
VPQQFLNRPVAAFQQMRGEGMPERVASGAFGQSGFGYRTPNAQRLAQLIEQFRLAFFKEESSPFCKGIFSECIRNFSYYVKPQVSHAPQNPTFLGAFPKNGITSSVFKLNEQKGSGKRWKERYLRFNPCSFL